MKTIAVFYQGRKHNTTEFAKGLVTTLEQKGYNVRAIDLLKEGQEHAGSSFRGADLVLVLGGDGTIVHAARLCANVGVPLVGINIGRVGFLTLDGDSSVWVDERAMLDAVLEQDGKREEFLALNDIVIARGKWPRVVQVQVWVDDYFYNTSYADGIIVSTATGSTAYNMAVGGPLLHPQVKSSVLTPIAAHLASDRSLILHPEARMRMQISTGSQPGVFSADGQMNREIQDGAVITVHNSQYSTKFLRRRPPTYFYQIINAKLTNDNNATPPESNHAT